MKRRFDRLCVPMIESSEKFGICKKVVSYGSAGNLVKRTDNRGFITQYTPDALGRCRAEDY